VSGNIISVDGNYNQGWWSRLNFNGSGSGARVSKLLSSDTRADHFPFYGSDSGPGSDSGSWLRLWTAPFDLNFDGFSSAPN